MAHVVTMPKFGLTMVEGTVTHWCKEVGDKIEAGEVLCEVQTEKITNDLESPQSGVLRHIFISLGTTVEVGASIAVIADENEDISNLLPHASNQAAPGQPVTRENQSGAADEPVASDTEAKDNEVNVIEDVQSVEAYTRATPYARKLARNKGVEVGNVQGSGPRGIVVSRDVAAFESSESLEAKPQTISPLAKKWADEQGVEWEKIDKSSRIMLPDVIAAHLQASNQTAQNEQNERRNSYTKPAPQVMKGARKVIAERMTQSWQQIPHVTLTREIDVTPLFSTLSVLQGEAEKWGVKVTLTHFLIKIVATALAQYPALNAWCNGKEITFHDDVNMGVAVAAPDGLLVPVIREANRKDIIEIAETLANLTTLAKEQRLTIDDMRDGTFTISNLGMMGIDAFTPIINPPETGILGVGRVIERPIFVEEKVERRSIIIFSLSFDHRALDGAEAAKFLGSIEYYITEPLRLLAGRGSKR